MSVIDTSTWGEFVVGELFESIERATRRTINTYVEGDVPYVTNSAFNNGISGYLEPKSDHDIERGQCITVNTVDGSTFWQGSDFLANSSGNGLLMLRHESLNAESALFVCAALSAVLDPTFTVMLTTDVVRNQRIKLPITPTGEPDWAYMESTMRGLMEQQERELNTLVALGETEPQPIDVSEWGEFRLDELFTIVKGARLTTAQRLPGGIPYVGASQFNNGITHYIGNDEKVHPGGVLSVCYNGPVGTTFYQPEPFWATDDVNVLYPKTKVSMEGLLFVAPAIESVGSEYAYIDKWKLTDMQATLIRLPQTAHGSPDWAYMESTMREHIEQREKTVDAFEAFV